MRPLPSLLYPSLTAALVLSGCAALSHDAVEISIPYQKHVLANGLEVVIHEDHSDPVVAVYVQYHVGSAREEPGRSGFAHLFEHMLFQGSEHVGDDQHFKLVQEAGGTLNGSTTRDRTNYFEVLPANQLELALWLEADRMGWFLPGVTQEKLDLQRDVVKNERRQNYENRPYGMSSAWISAALYPPEHPYHWLTIGSMEDLSAASLEDVKSFFSRWYGPNNATLAIGGDIDPKTALALVEKYFGNIPRGPAVGKPDPRPVVIAKDQRMFAEDKVKLPELVLTWTAVEQQHPDEAALDLLERILTANDTSVLTKALTVDEPLCANVSSNHDSGEVAGEFSISLRANPGVTLDRIEARTRELLAQLARDGISAEQLERVQGRYESDLLRRQESVGPRTSMLANLNCFQHDPSAWRKNLDRRLAVTPQDVRRVLQHYVLGKPSLALSVVPQGKPELAAQGSSAVAPIGSTAIASWKSSEPAVAERKPAPDSFDRSVKPAPGPMPQFRSPTVWHDAWSNGVAVAATPFEEVPLALLTLSVPAGQLNENERNAGIASLTAQMLTQGTAHHTAQQFQNELDRLGANLNANASEEDIVLTLNVPERRLEEAAKLLAEVVLEPRFAQNDFERLKAERLVAIDARADQIRTIANNVYKKLLYGKSPLGLPGAGTHESVAQLTEGAVREYWKEHANSTAARLTYVGSRDASGLRSALARLVSEWRSPPHATNPVAERRSTIERTHVYFVDKPGAAQSEIRIGQLSDSALSSRYYGLQVLNQPLGGNFSSRVNMNLREDKGYTYGARTAFEGGRSFGQFTASAGVQTDASKKGEGGGKKAAEGGKQAEGGRQPDAGKLVEGGRSSDSGKQADSKLAEGGKQTEAGAKSKPVFVTKESVYEFMKEIKGILDGPTEKEMAFTKDALLQGALRQYESMGALNGYLENISRYGYADDYAAKRLQQLSGMKRETLRDLAQKVLQPDHMVILVVGDKAKVKASLAELGYGDVIELDIDGNPLPTTASGQ